MSKQLTLLLPAFIAALTALQAQEQVVIEGVYKGKDLYIQNPFASEGVGFCAYEVRVNGEVSSDEVNSTAFAVDLSQYGFKNGDAVTVTISHKKGCAPSCINPLAVQPESVFTVKEINLAPDGLLMWTSTGENGSLPYRIEQFKWNKWVGIGEVIGKGTPGENSYRFQTDLHFGENTLRVSQLSGSGDRRTSGPVKVKSNRPGAVELLSEKVSAKIEFSGPTAYELFSEYGELVARGHGREIGIQELPKGTYYLNFGATTGAVVRKK